MSTSKGIARTQYTSGSAGKSGAITVAQLKVTGAAGSVPVNLSTEGAKDWLLHSTSGSPLDPYNNQGGAQIHGKRLNGYMRRSGFWRYFGPGGTLAAATTTASPWAFTTTLGDDDTPNGAVNTNFANALNVLVGWTSNNSLSLITGGFGFVVGTLASAAAVRTMNVYCGFSSGGTRTDTQFECLGRLLDGSAGDVSTTVLPGVTGQTFWKVTFTFRSGGEGVPFIASFRALQQAADAATQIFFGAATAF